MFCKLNGFKEGVLFLNSTCFTDALASLFFYKSTGVQVNKLYEYSTKYEYFLKSS